MPSSTKHSGHWYEKLFGFNNGFGSFCQLFVTQFSQSLKPTTENWRTTLITSANRYACKTVGIIECNQAVNIIFSKMPFYNRTLCNYYLYASCHLKSYQRFVDLLTSHASYCNFFDCKIRRFENSRSNSNRVFIRGLAVRLFEASRDVITFHGPVIWWTCERCEMIFTESYKKMKTIVYQFKPKVKIAQNRMEEVKDFW